MVRLISLKEHWYAGKTRKPGDSYDATDSDAKLLLGIEKATLDVQIKTAPKVALETKQQAASEAPQQQEQQEEDDKPRRGRYSRRDLRPED